MVNIELIFNKRLRKNFSESLKLQNNNETKEFLTNLDETSRRELLSFMDFAYIHRRKIGRPITEYFLLHYKDYMTEAETASFKRADRVLNTIYAIAIVVILIILIN